VGVTGESVGSPEMPVDGAALGGGGPGHGGGTGSPPTPAVGQPGGCPAMDAAGGLPGPTVLGAAIVVAGLPTFRAPGPVPLAPGAEALEPPAPAPVAALLPLVADAEPRRADRVDRPGEEADADADRAVWLAARVAHPGNAMTAKTIPAITTAERHSGSPPRYLQPISSPHEWSVNSASGIYHENVYHRNFSTDGLLDL
jgi:hypothetical protein